MAFSEINTVITDSLGVSQSVGVFLIVVIGVWSLVWKGLALWKSAGKGQKVWFVVLLVFNTIGILEILYIYIFSKMDMSGKKGNDKGKDGDEKKGSVGKEKVKKKK